MINNSDIESISVRVNRGSGVIVSIANRYFVVTALHCLNKDSDDFIESYDKKKIYHVEKRFFHKDSTLDIALLEITSLVDELLSVPTIRHIKISSEDEIKAYGFPSKKEVGEPMLGSVSQWNSVAKTIKTELSYVGSNIDDEKTINNISGWSGSGVFKKNGDGTLVLIGVLSSLTDAEYAYQTINCISIETVKEVIEFHGLDRVDGVEINRHKILIGDNKCIEIKTVPVEVDGKVLNVSIYPVTFEEYDLFCEDIGNKFSFLKGYENKPVVKVSWDNAYQYCEWLSKKINRKCKLINSEVWKYITLEKGIKVDKNISEWCEDGNESEKKLKIGSQIELVDLNLKNLKIGFRYNILGS
jgi:hypothetical protein